MHEVTEEILAASEYFYDPSGPGIFGRAWTAQEFESVGDDPVANDYRYNGGYVFGDWASYVYPQGEGGSRHISRCLPIPREVYEQCKDAGWQMDILIVGVI